MKNSFCLWEEYSKKMKEKLKSLSFAGFFSLQEAQNKQMRLVTGKEVQNHRDLCFYWLVDETDGVVADVRYQVVGETPLIALAEIACELIIRKNYDQVSRITADLLERQAKEKKEPPFSKDFYPFFNLILSAIDQGVHQCLDLPFKDTYEDTPVFYEEENIEPIEGWETFSPEKKRAYIEEILEKQIRPYIELDAGGIEIIEFNENHQLKIRYSGSCTSCFAATGSTLSAIQNILRTYLHPSIEVIPEL